MNISSFIIPHLIILLSSFISLFIWIDKKNKNVSFDIAIVSLIFSLAFFISYLNIAKNSFYIFSSSPFNNIAIIYILILTIITLNSQKELIKDEIKFGEYILLTSITIISSMVLISSDNLFTIFITIELLSISLYSLVGFNKTEQATESSIKYLIIGSFATIFFILSLIFLKFSSLPLELLDISNHPKTLSSSISAIFFLSGLFFKIAIFPMHSWSVDVYCGAPTYVTTKLVSFIKFSVLIVAYRVYSSFINHVPIEIIYLITILTLIIPSISALKTQNIKKILIYSGISHAGYLLIGFLSSSNPYFYFYAIVYTINSFGVFLIVNLIENKYKNLEISTIKEIWYTQPYLVILLSVFLFSLAGIPPFSGFFAKFYLFYSAIKNNHILIVIVASIATIISSYYYIKILVPIFSTKTSADSSKIDDIFKENPFTTTTITFLAFIVLILGIFSSPVLELITKTI